MIIIHFILIIMMVDVLDIAELRYIIVNLSDLKSIAMMAQVN